MNQRDLNVQIRKWKSSENKTFFLPLNFHVCQWFKVPTALWFEELGPFKVLWDICTSWCDTIMSHLQVDEFWMSRLGYICGLNGHTDLRKSCFVVLQQEQLSSTAPGQYSWWVECVVDNRIFWLKFFWHYSTVPQCLVDHDCVHWVFREKCEKSLEWI